MLDSLKLGRAYDGFLFLAEPMRSLNRIHSHRHVEIELNVIVRGVVTYVVDGRRFSFSPRTLLWFFPQQEHQMVDLSDNAQFYVAVFKPALIKRSCHTPAYAGLLNAGEEREGVLNSLLGPESFDLITHTMESLMRGALEPELLNKEAGYGPASGFSFEHHDPDALNAGLHYLLMLCWRTQLQGESAGGATVLHPAVRRALKLLSEGANEQNLAELAKACGTSKSYLSRTFHRQIGVPLNRYRNSLRLSRFFEEYQKPDQKTLAEAVYAAGFGSYARFYKVFTQAYGRGPREALTVRPHA